MTPPNPGEPGFRIGDVIRTSRLRLLPMNVAFVEAVLALRPADAAQAIGVELTEEWPTGNERWLEQRLERLRERPADAPWLSRVVVLDGTLVGRAGFHHPPIDGQSEFGYEIDPSYRRRGLASEAVRGLIRWGFSHPELARMVACIAPSNAVSIHMVTSLGFRFARAVEDPVDGVEHCYELGRDAAARLYSLGEGLSSRP